MPLNVVGCGRQTDAVPGHEVRDRKVGPQERFFNFFEHINGSIVFLLVSLLDS